MTVKERFIAAFIESDRWKLYISGLGITLEIALFAGILGIIIGTILALMKLSTTEEGKPTIFNYIATIYIDVIRGTPSVLQLLIMWFIIMASSNNGILVASLSFGINSGAYVAEIVRGGIMAVDKGQMEAGRSLGLSKAATMRYIVLPQAVKNIIPPLGNEFITLIKETAIVGYVSLTDLTRVANQIASRTYDAFMPLIGVAVIYFVIIKLLSTFLGKLERRMRVSDHR
ncbi:polar amino acid transport system permease protein [Butyrivibrio hungatei DSM 14810]|uniref:Amino acid ABC transporter permease protein n=2 Tax=Butyrivibrio hungatei TaxID=185008 RepID=A0A1D9NY66_9FIRM|nr:amino acid ABC transporter permease [Butyrivibrio hungatei]AOZ95162.1 amino acid ABC transporter permease protein [Butyrivibrio hungatei]SHN57797.1 polar amino acid transport system permease protein [Butyrivibrio hungatei DSM 14810]